MVSRSQTIAAQERDRDRNKEEREKKETVHQQPNEATERRIDIASESWHKLPVGQTNEQTMVLPDGENLHSGGKCAHTHAR
jgi:hypothetical protein